MRIAFVYDVAYPYSVGGIEFRNYILANYLKKNHSIVFYTAKQWSGAPVRKKDGITYVGFSIFKKGFTGRRSLLESIRFALSMFKVKHVDIVETAAIPYSHLFCLKLNCAIRRIPIVITWHGYWDTYWYSYTNPFIATVGYLFEKMSIYLSNYNVVVSNTVKQLLLQNSFRSSQFFFHSPNGVDFAKVQQIKPATKKFDFLFVGRVCHQKNPTFFLELAKLHPSKNFCMIGDGPLLQDMKKRASHIPNITFLGAITHEKTLSYMKSSSILVVPSYWEGFGIVVAEATACGMKVCTLKTSLNAAVELVPASNTFTTPSDIIPHKLKSAKQSCDWRSISKSFESYLNSVVKK